MRTGKYTKALRSCASILLLGLVQAIYPDVARADAYPTPLFKAGFRLPDGSWGDQSTIFYLGVSVALWKQELPDHSKLIYLSPGVNFQSNHRLSPSLSPISWAGISGLSAGLDLFPLVASDEGSFIGAFVGYSFDIE